MLFTTAVLLAVRFSLLMNGVAPGGVPVDSYRRVICLIGPGERGERDEETGNDGDGCKKNLHKSSFSPC